MKVIKTGAFIIHWLFSWLLIFVLAYFLGCLILIDPLSGNDALNNLTQIVYLKQNLPHIPFWFPYQGGGVSLTMGYPQLYSLAVIYLAKISHLTLISSMSILNFAALLLPAWGIYLLVALRLKSWLGGLIAGILYLLSPMSYIWIYGAGFLAQTFSMIFVAPFILFYDWWLDSVLNKQKRWYLLIGLYFFGTLALLAHPVTLMGLIAFSGLYTLGRVMDSAKQYWSKRLVSGLGALILMVVVVVGLNAWSYLPLESYTSYANRDMAQTLDTSTAPPLKILGVAGLLGRIYPFGDFSIVPPVWILGTLALVLGIIVNRKVAIMAFLGLLAICLTGSLSIWQFLARGSFFFAQFFSIRQWYPLASVLNPIAGGMAGVLLGRLLFKRFKILNFLITPILAILVTVSALFFLMRLSGYYQSGDKGAIYYGQSVLGFNYQHLWDRDPIKESRFPRDNSLYKKYFQPETFWRMCDSYPQDKEKLLVCLGEKQITRTNQWQEWDPKTNTQYQVVQHEQVLVPLEEKEILDFVNQCAIDRRKIGPISFYPYYSPCLALGKTTTEQLKYWPLPLFKFGTDDFTVFKQNFEIPEDKKEILYGKNHRIDVTPGFGTAVKSWNVNYQSGMLNAYTGQLTLIKSFYSIFNDNFHDSKNTLPTVLNNLAHYFGTEAVVVVGSKGPMDNLAEAGWERYGDEAAVVFPPFKTGLISLGKLPKVLVVGSQSKSAYQQVFREAITGALLFDQGILLKGKEDLGSYSEVELANYDLIVMHGYRYRNRLSDLVKLKKYLEKGGSVFIESGWQYVSADWGKQKNNQGIYTSQLPDPFPVAETQWGAVGKDWQSCRLDSEIATDINCQNFGSLTWEDNQWSVASAGQTKTWAKPVLSIEDRILVAEGPVGKGKIVWSGMNLVAHALDKKSTEETRYLGSLFAYLLGDKKIELNEGYAFERPSPDRLEITIKAPIDQGQSIYFKEAYFPSWKAFLVDGRQKRPLPIHLAGPDFMLVNLPAVSAGQKIIFEFQTPRSLVLGIVVSFGTLILLVLLPRLKMIVEKNVHLKGHWFKIKNKITKDDEDY